MERFGIRRVVAVRAAASSPLGSGLTVFMTASWQLVLCWGVLVGLGTGLDGAGARRDGDRPLVRRPPRPGLRRAHRRRRGRAAGVPAAASRRSTARTGWRPASLGRGRRAGRRAARGLAAARPARATGRRRRTAARPADDVDPVRAPRPRDRRCAALRDAARTPAVLAAGRRVRDLRRHDQRAGRSRTSSRPRTTTGCR